MPLDKAGCLGLVVLLLFKFPGGPLNKSLDASLGLVMALGDLLHYLLFGNCLKVALGFSGVGK